MSAFKIIDNLYIGGPDTIPQDVELVIGCVTDLGPNNRKKNTIYDHDQEWIWKDEKHLFLKFKECASWQELDSRAIIQGLKVINSNINAKMIYIYCHWGINESAAIVFMFLVAKGFLADQDFSDAWEQFERIYLYANPAQGWMDFLESEFPYYHLMAN